MASITQLRRENGDHAFVTEVGVRNKGHSSRFVSEISRSDAADAQEIDQQADRRMSIGTAPESMLRIVTI
jgi:hypothetical protein